MKSTTSVLVVTAVCLSLAACQQFPRFSVFNASDSSVTIIADDSAERVQANTCSRRFRMPLETRIIKIVPCPSMTNSYYLQWPQPFEPYGLSGAIHLRLQYMPDNRLYILRKDETPPRPAFECPVTGKCHRLSEECRCQPQGYPLVPETDRDPQ